MYSKYVNCRIKQCELLFQYAKKYIVIWEKELMPFLFFALMRGTKDK